MFAQGLLGSTQPATSQSLHFGDPGTKVFLWETVLGDLCFSSLLACSCLMEYGNLLQLDQLVSWTVLSVGNHG